MRVTKKKIFGVCLIIIAFSGGMTDYAMAQSCTVPPTCDVLGYIKTAANCKGMSTLKCPFDQSKVFCVTAAEVPEGDGGACKVADFGDILFSDMSCGSSIVDGKHAIGIIFEPDYRLAVALKESNKYWSVVDFNIPGLPNLFSEREALSDYNGKYNTQTIMSFCIDNDYSCLAAEYAYNYSTLGTKARDWYLPASGELNLMYIRKDKLNSVLTALGADILSNLYWSSSEYGTDYAWTQSFPGSSISTRSKTYNLKVRPILAF